MPFAEYNGYEKIRMQQLEESDRYEIYELYDMYMAYAERLQNYVTDTVTLIHSFGRFFSTDRLITKRFIIEISGSAIRG